MARLAEHQLYQDSPLDIRFPDWPVLLSPLLEQGEVVKHCKLGSVGAAEMSDFRIAVVTTRTHVIGIINDENGRFRVYDNDSAERHQGMYARMRGDEVIDKYSTGALDIENITGIMLSGSDLSSRLGAAITTLRTNRQAPRAADRPPPKRHTTQARFARGSQATLTAWFTSGTRPP